MGAIRQLARMGGGGFNPLSLNPALWYNTDNVVNDGSGFAQQLLDISGNDRHSLTQSGTSKPQIITNDHNARSALLFDGSNDYINSPNFSLNQPCSIFVAFKHITYVNDKGIIGSIVNNSVISSVSGFYSMYANTPSGIPPYLNIAPVDTSGTIHILSSIFDQLQSRGKVGEISRIGKVGTFNFGGISIGRYGNLNSTCSNIKFYELIVYNKKLNEIEESQVRFWLKSKYSASFTVENELFDGVYVSPGNILDQNMYVRKNAHSEYKFNYSGDFLKISVNPRLYSNASNREFCQLSILANNTEVTTLYPLTTDYTTVSLPFGEKEISIIEGLTSKPTTEILGTWIQSIKGDIQKFSKINAQIVSEKIIFIGDSITVGANSAKPQLQGVTSLFKFQNNKNVDVMGWGYGLLADFASDSTKINDTVAKIQSLFSNVTTTKKLVIALGTNDYGLSSLAAATFISYYSALLDAINASDSSIEIFCVSPLYRQGETSLLTEYRSGMVNMCATRAFTTYVDGLTMTSYPTDYHTDNLHLTTNGHKNYHDNLSLIIL